VRSTKMRQGESSAFQQSDEEHSVEMQQEKIEKLAEMRREEVLKYQQNDKDQTQEKKIKD